MGFWNDIGLTVQSIFGNTKAQDQLVYNMETNPVIPPKTSQFISDFWDSINPFSFLNDYVDFNKHPLSANQVQDYQQSQKDFVAYQKKYKNRVYIKQYSDKQIDNLGSGQTPTWLKWGLIGLILLLFLR